MKWPYIENDHMEIGKTGWVPISEGRYLNIHNGHWIDENGIEYDSEGNIIQELE
jgi:hypothetical protein